MSFSTFTRPIIDVTRRLLVCRDRFACAFRIDSMRQFSSWRVPLNPGIVIILIIVFMLIVHGTSLLPSIYRWADVTVNVFGELPVMSVMLINVSHKRMRIMLHFTAGRKSHGRHARSGHPMSFSGSGHLKEAPRGRMEP
ncbi:hypothetical protein AB4918_07575 [Bifidobacterium dentium]|uniref:hypothetical protein n=1 Tax=Bifidobacterium TaxID=1678 RepID=UPI0022DF036D|nr:MULTISPECIES: hypothetical protein [Bifidobacterium]MDU5321357.1 hypothetical protein [Bifidobacterium sp.]MDU5899479.1 hypothetical protein [Bifidobacterium sp.]